MESCVYFEFHNWEKVREQDLKNDESLHKIQYPILVPYKAMQYK